MDRGGAAEGETVDEAEEAEADAAGEDEEGAEAARGGGVSWVARGRGRRVGGGLQEKEEDRAGEVAVVHEMLVDATKGIDDGESLGGGVSCNLRHGGRGQEVPLP